MEHLGSVRGLQLSRQPSDLVRLTEVSRIGKTMERRVDKVKQTGELAMPSTTVY